MEGKLYFAYGSNINLEQMDYRCPNAEVVGPVVLEGYELLFRSGYRENGVATIAPKAGSRVHGLLWKITPKCERSLDMYEGYPRLYGKEPVTVRGEDGMEVTVMAYIMNADLPLVPSLPSERYLKGIQEGYQQNGLPVPELEKAWQHAFHEVVHQSKPRSAPPKRRDEHGR